MNASQLQFTPGDVGNYQATLVVTDKDGGVTTATQHVNVTTIDSTSLQDYVNAEGPPQYSVGLGLQPDSAHVSAFVNALNSIVAPAGYDYDGNPIVSPVYVTLNLNGGTYPDLNFNLQPLVIVTVNGVDGSTTVVGHSPALTVNSGNVIVNNVTLTTATDSPTILVSGGNLSLRNDVVQESTGYTDAAISVTGGSVDLGTASSPGSNTININGSGSPVQSSGAGVVTAVGDTFQSNGNTVNPLSSLTLTSSVNPAFFGQPITLTATIAVGSTQTSTPTGTVTFYDLTRGVTLGGGRVSKSVAQWTGSSLGPGGHTILAVYSGDANFITSSSSLVQNVSSFSGFFAPLSNNLAFNMNRVIPIKWQLGDSNGKVITGLSAVVSLQVAPFLSGGALGTPFNPMPSNGIGLRNDGKQYSFNWDTKGIAVGTYQIQLTLADGTVQTKTLQIVTKGGYSGLLIDGTSATSTGVGGLLGGDIFLYVDNTNGNLTADELARIQDAVTAADAVTEPYGVAVQEVTDPTLADVTLNMDTTSAVGGYADGVLGCTTDAGQITLIQGWNFYAGSDGTQISSGQYDFETVVTHELGHALGLGHSTDSTSVMYATLNAGTINRTLTTADLNVADSATTGACGLHAAAVSAPAGAMASTLPAASFADPDAYFVALMNGVSTPGLAPNALLQAQAHDAVFAEPLGDVGATIQGAHLATENPSPMFVGSSLSQTDDELPVGRLDARFDFLPADGSWGTEI
jgi:hypothetical protein